MIIRVLENVPSIEWGNGLSRRFLLNADNMGYTLTDTIVYAGTKSPLKYRNHLKACYCIEGEGAVEDLMETCIRYGRERCTHSTATTHISSSQHRILISGLCACSFPRYRANSDTASTRQGFHILSTAFDSGPRPEQEHKVINWNADQRALRAGLTTWCEALSADHVEQDASGVFPWDKWKLIKECGVLQLPFDERWGGLGQDLYTTMYVLEGLGHDGDGGLNFSVSTHIVSTEVSIRPSFGGSQGTLPVRNLRR